MRFLKTALFAVAALFAVGFVFGGFYTVAPGERGVLIRLGSIVRISEPGLHFKIPYVDRVQPISVQTHVMRLEKVESYSKDQQPADMRISVNWEIPPSVVADVVAEFGNEQQMVDRLISPRVHSEFKVVFGQFTAATAIQERGKLTIDATAALQRAVQGPVRIVSLQIENIDFSDAYEKSIEQRMLAEVEVQRLRQNAEREKVQAEITVTVARADADAVRQKAMADAEAIKLRGNAEAEVIRARGAALKETPGLVDLAAVERWNGVLPTQMIPGGTLPFIELGNKAK
ncbi:MAG: prohibitin family protein [Siculibacillus sp.]|nr:prohibitin family protein [Siculibacillus sp.]